MQAKLQKASSTATNNNTNASNWGFQNGSGTIYRGPHWWQVALTAAPVTSEEASTMGAATPGAALPRHETAPHCPHRPPAPPRRGRDVSATVNDLQHNAGGR